MDGAQYTRRFLDDPAVFLSDEITADMGCGVPQSPMMVLPRGDREGGALQRELSTTLCDAELAAGAVYLRGGPTRTGFALGWMNAAQEEGVVGVFMRRGVVVSTVAECPGHVAKGGGITLTTQGAASPRVQKRLRSSSMQADDATSTPAISGHGRPSGTPYTLGVEWVETQLTAGAEGESVHNGGLPVWRVVEYRFREVHWLPGEAAATLCPLCEARARPTTLLDVGRNIAVVLHRDRAGLSMAGLHGNYSPFGSGAWVSASGRVGSS